MMAGRQQYPRLLPNLVVAQRVLDHMATAAHAWQSDETGEALVGLVEPGVNTNGVPGIYLLDTIPPDDSALRMAHTFQQGDPRQDEILWWLQENWRARRQRDEGLPPKWDAPLRYLGDWHKQPAGMTHPSHADLRTAKHWLRDPENHMTFLLAPIVTHGNYIPHDAGYSNPNRILIDGQTCVDFWYLHLGDRRFRPVFPAIYQDAQLPRLAEVPWHLEQPERLEYELARLREMDFTFSPLLFLDLLEHSDLEVCFMLGRAGAEQLFLVATPADYPRQPPQLRPAPFTATAMDDEAGLHERFLQRWQAAPPLSAPPVWDWQPDRSLAALIEQLERDPALRTKAPARPAKRSDRPDRDAP